MYTAPFVAVLILVALAVLLNACVVVCLAMRVLRLFFHRPARRIEPDVLLKRQLHVTSLLYSQPQQTRP